MNTPEQGSKNLIIFDKFYRNPAYHSGYDSISKVVEGRHNVVASAYDLPSAVSLLMEVKHGALTPDAIVTGGMLEDETEYMYDPPVVTSRETKTVRTLRGKKEKIVDVHHLVLPVIDTHGDVHFPRLGNPEENAKSRAKFEAGWDRSRSEMALSGFVIAHLSKQFFADRNIKIIGHASTPFGETVPVDAFVNKRDYARPFWLSDEIEKPLDPR